MLFDDAEPQLQRHARRIRPEREPSGQSFPRPPTGRTGPVFSSRLSSAEGEPPPDGVGAIRQLGMGFLGSREEVVEWDAPSHLGYVILSSMLPVRNYRADIFLEESSAPRNHDNGHPMVGQLRPCSARDWSDHDVDPACDHHALRKPRCPLRRAPGRVDITRLTRTGPVSSAAPEEAERKQMRWEIEDTPEQAEFRAEFKEWLGENLAPGWIEAVESGDDDAFEEVQDEEPLQPVRVVRKDRAQPVRRATLAEGVRRALRRAVDGPRRSAPSSCATDSRRCR